MDEERELFPAVLASAEPGDEHDRVQAIVQRLTQQHRELEALWKSMEKDLRRVAKGQDSELAPADVHRLVNEYQAHALFEELDFLPLAQAILGRNGNHMAALGLSLHLRHAPQPAPYV
jgi:hemerythrin-like domain-containing protein